MRAQTLIAFLVVFAACGEEVEPGSLVDRQRILGAQLEVAGEPERATPRPGETLDVTWIQAAPGAPAPLAWRLSLCAIDDDKGACVGPETSFSGNGPVWSFAVPPAELLRASGVICAGGSVDGDDCVGDDAVRTAIDLRIAVAVEGMADMNHNPSLGAGAMAIDGKDWPAEGTCVAAGKEITVRLTTTASDRESYRDEDGKTVREDLQLAFFATAGEMNSQYGFIQDEALSAEVKWTAPDADEVGEGLSIEFSFVVRDGRGGTDYTTRTLCVR